MPLETGERPWSASLPLASAKGMAMPGGTGRGSFTATAFRSRDVLKDDLGLAGRRGAGISYPAEGAALPAGEAGFPGDQRGSPPSPRGGLAPRPRSSQRSATLQLRAGLQQTGRGRAGHHPQALPHLGAGTG